MKSLFDKTRVGSIRLKNRLVRAGTYENTGVSDLTGELYQYYQELAQGGVGIIITEFTDVLSGGVDGNSFTNQYKQITKMVHQYDTKIILQIGYCSFSYKDNWVVWGPSAVENVRTKVQPREMSRETIRCMQMAFADAAQQAKEIGFDGVEIQGAQGFLLNQFLSPYYNRRKDEYGGSIENRARMILDLCRVVRERVGSFFPIIMKINAVDSIVPGMTFQECKYVCGKLAEQGIDAIEITGDWQDISPRPPAYFKKFAAELAAEIPIPVILDGGERDYDVMLSILNTTAIEYFSLARPLIAEPDLVKRWENGDTRAAKCISCNACLNFDGVFFCILNN
ncbi:MAG: dehydrogenase [Firmicutes bacterium]|nr:dehydrogenase [Bacillota bacterium]